MELGNNRVWTRTQVCLTLIELHLHSAIPIHSNTHTHTDAYCKHVHVLSDYMPTRTPKHGKKVH